MRYNRPSFTLDEIFEYVVDLIQEREKLKIDLQDQRNESYRLSGELFKLRKANEAKLDDTNSI